MTTDLCIHLNDQYPKEQLSCTLLSSSLFSFTFTPNEKVYCSTEDSQRCQGLNQYACGQVHGAHYTNVGCYEKVSSSSRQMFQCANRMDLASSMFNTAIMNFEQTKITPKALNLNTQLNFNETHLNCSRFINKKHVKIQKIQKISSNRNNLVQNSCHLTK